MGIDEKIDLERDSTGQKDDELKAEPRGKADAPRVGKVGDVASRNSCQEFEFDHVDSFCSELGLHLRFEPAV